MVKTIEWREGKVIMLDQSRLPSEVRFLECTDFVMVAEGIKALKIRGAPAIGIAAAMGIALGARGIEADTHDQFTEMLEPVFGAMLATRPTAVNIQWAVKRMKHMLAKEKGRSVPALKELLVREAMKILHEDIEVNRSIGRYGAELIEDGDTILTHCNAGALATGGYGTATAPMLHAKEQGKRIQVFADETRPVLQGARLTAWELMQEGIPVTLITDNSAGSLMRKGNINLIIVGTDRTVRNGDVANKIGTYPLAVLAKEHGIPFYVAAPTSSIDLSIPTGDEIPIEERDPSEITHVYGKVSYLEDSADDKPPKQERVRQSTLHSSWGAVRIAPEGIAVKNMAFDVTPARYITAIITEKGIFRPEDIKMMDLR
ncbi:MAG TPA: S-methyl-5-thioribose-1-phosphate isomerase [Thermodesulfovibrionales bacterium]|nr:S-methyl-5-thioribose-1-phosphate isomerase [Thermodesulfovibrionales bacterium]